MRYSILGLVLLAACGHDDPARPYQVDLTPEAEKLVGLWFSELPPQPSLNGILLPYTRYRFKADGTVGSLKWTLKDTVFVTKDTFAGGIISPGLYVWNGDPAYDPYEWEKSGDDEWTVTIIHRLKFETDDQVMIDFPGDYQPNRYRLLIRQDQED